MKKNINEVLGTENLLGTRMKTLIELFDTRKYAASIAGVSTDMLARYMRGDNQPSFNALVNLCKYKEINLNWLVYGEGETFLVDALNNSSNSDEISEFSLIPGYNIQISAGNGTEAGKEQVTRKLAFRHKWLKYKGLKEKDLVLVFAKGDSMEPTISDNNTLMIDTSQLQLNDGHIYVIRFNNHLVVKRIQTTMTGFYLISDNKEYKEMEITYNEADDLQVIGRVVWIGKDL